MRRPFASNVASSLAHRLDRLPGGIRYGVVAGITGLLVEVEGLADTLAIGDRCRLVDRDGEPTLAEVVGFRAGRSLLMPYGTVARIGPGCRAEVGSDDDAVYPSEGWLGRVVGALGDPLDGLGPLTVEPAALSLTQRAAAGARAPARAGQARSRRPGAERVPDVLPGTASRRLLRLRRRQVQLAVDAGAAYRGGRHRHRPASGEMSLRSRAFACAYLSAKCRARTVMSFGRSTSAGICSETTLRR